MLFMGARNRWTTISMLFGGESLSSQRERIFFKS